MGGGDRRAAELDVPADGMDRPHWRSPGTQRRFAGGKLDGSSTAPFANVSVTTTSVQPDTAYAGSAFAATPGSAVTFSRPQPLEPALHLRVELRRWHHGHGHTQPHSHLPEPGHFHRPVHRHRCPRNTGHEHGRRHELPGPFPRRVQLEHPQLRLVLRGRTWQINNGVLSQTSTAAADPKKAMITNQTYPSNLMITAEVQVNSWNAGDMARAGVGLYTNTSNGLGYNLVFHDTNQVQFLDDYVTWGNAYTFNWQVGTWYWFQLAGDQRDLGGQGVGGGDRRAAEQGAGDDTLLGTDTIGSKSSARGLSRPLFQHRLDDHVVSYITTSIGSRWATQGLSTPCEPNLTAPKRSFIEERTSYGGTRPARRTIVIQPSTYSLSSTLYIGLNSNIPMGISVWNAQNVTIADRQIGEVYHPIELKEDAGVSKTRRSKRRTFDVFLCHNSGDKPVVKDIGERLKERGIRPWLDEWELRPGMPWQKNLENQIQSIKAAAVFVGTNGIGPWQDMELDAFLRELVNRKCPVIRDYSKVTGRIE